MRCAGCGRATRRSDDARAPGSERRKPGRGRRFLLEALRGEGERAQARLSNFAIDEPPLELVLLEALGAAERLDHPGVEVFEQGDVDAAIARSSCAGIAGAVEVERACCHAVQNKVRSSDPQGARWEFYRVVAHSEAFAVPPPVATPTAPAASARGCG